MSEEVILLNISKITITDILSGEQQMVMPIYQRRYSWEKEQCEDLIRDILRADTTSREHFIGPIVVVVEDGGLGSIRKFQVIDGQQRLTTLYLLLLAVYNYLQETTGDNEFLKEKFSLKSILFMGRTDWDEYALKIKPTDIDQDVLKALVYQDKSTQSDKNHNLFKNYAFFYDRLKKKVTSVEQILNGVNLLRFAQIRLGFDDDPQTTFESLNATGKGLTEGELIQNFLFMGISLKEQTRLYNLYWKELYKKILTLDKKIDEFLIFYLETKLRRSVSNKKLHQEFKTFYFERYGTRTDEGKSVIDLENLMVDLNKYWDVYSMIKNKTHSIAVFNDCYKVFETLEVDKVLPLLAELTLLHQSEKIETLEFVEICELIESYIFRRSLCVKDDKKKYPAMMLALVDALDFSNSNLNSSSNLSIKEAVIQRFVQESLIGGTHTFPTDKDFKEALIKTPIYKKNSSKTKYILLKFANYKSKELINIESFTIEHIMPQTLTNKWKHSLGRDWQEIYNTYLHTLGNLTLTKANSEMGNLSFEEKKTIAKGFNQSNLWLNEELRTLDVWNEETILNRANNLADVAIQIWKFPKKILEQTPFQLSESKLTSLSLADTWTHCEVKGYSFLGEVSELYSLSDVFQSFCKVIYDLEPSIFNRYNALHKNDQYPLFTKTIPNNNIPYISIDDTGWVAAFYLKKNAERKRQVISDLVSLAGFNQDEFYLITESSPVSNSSQKAITLDDDWTSFVFEGYSFMGQTKEVSNGINLLMEVLEILHQEFGDVLFDDYMIEYPSKTPWISTDASQLRSFKRLGETKYFIESQTSSKSKQSFLLKLLELQNLPKSELIIYGSYKNA